MIVAGILNIILILWELPQNLLGLILLMAGGNKINAKEYLHRRLFVSGKRYSIGLGHFIFWTDHVHFRDKIAISNKEHEYGHAVQSMILGPLYLPLIGIPSVFRNAYGAWYFAKNKSSWKNYYAGFPENWADRLGKRYFSHSNTKGTEVV